MSKLQHSLQSHIEPCSAAHNFDVNAVTTEHNSFSCHLQGSVAPVFNQALKTGHVGFVTDTYISSNLLSFTNVLAEDNLGVLFNNG